MHDINWLHVFLAGLGVLLILMNDALRKIATVLTLVIVVIAGVMVFAPSAAAFH